MIKGLLLLFRPLTTARYSTLEKLQPLQMRACEEQHTRSLETMDTPWH